MQKIKRNMILMKAQVKKKAVVVEARKPIPMKTQLKLNHKNHQT